MSLLSVHPVLRFLGCPCGSAGKEFTCNGRDLGLIPGLGRSPGEGKGYPLQYSGLENSMEDSVFSMGSQKVSHGLCGPWDSPGQNTAVGSLSLLQGIFTTQGSNLVLPHCRRILYQLSHKGSPLDVEEVKPVNLLCKSMY